MISWILDTKVLKKMNKIAVIDTGINLDYREFKGKRIEIYSIKDEMFCKDYNGHGTSCCAEILKYNPQASLIVIPVLDINCTCRLSELYDALVYCCNSTEIGIINLSLACSINDRNIIKMFAMLMDKILKKGKIVVASDKNKKLNAECVYPYDFSNVLGVQKSNHSIYNIVYDECSNKCEIMMDEFFMPYKDEKYMIYRGNSSMAAKVTGLLSYELRKLKTKRIPMHELLNLCNIRLQQDDRAEKEFCSDGHISNIQILYKDLVNLWFLFLDKRNEEMKQSEESVRIYYESNGGDFLKAVEKELDLNFDFRGIMMDDFKSLSRLIRKCLYLTFKEPVDEISKDKGVFN